MTRGAQGKSERKMNNNQRGVLEVKETTTRREDSLKEAWSVQWHRPSFQAFFKRDRKKIFVRAVRGKIIRRHSIVFVIL